MKKILFALAAIALIEGCASNASVFELTPQQSMLMTGKGPGQDAAINPFKNSRSIAIVKSLGSNPFEVRVQAKGEIIKIIRVEGKEKKEVLLEPGYELYLDATIDAKAKISFKKYKNI